MNKIIIVTNNNVKINAINRNLVSNSQETTYFIRRPQNALNRTLFNEKIMDVAYNHIKSCVVDNDDMAVSFEEGFVKTEKGCFFVDVCCIKDKEGYRTGCGKFYKITNNIYRFVSLGLSLPELLRYLSKSEQNIGLIKYLTADTFKSCEGCEKAFVSALESPYSDSCSLKLTNTTVVNFKNERLKLLDDACKKQISKYL